MALKSILPQVKVAFIQGPTNIVAGSAIHPPVTVAVEDQSGNIVMGDTSMVTLTLAGGPGGFATGSTTSVQAVNGVATFSNLIFDTAGSYALSASDGGAHGGHFGKHQRDGGGREQARVAAGEHGDGQRSTQSNSGGRGGPIWQRSHDRQFDGEPECGQRSGYASSGPGNFTGGSTTSVSAVNGVASFPDLTLSTPGAYMLTAADGALAAADSNSFSVATLPFPYVVSIVGNTPGSNFSGGNLSYTVTFSEPVTGITPADFVLATTGTAGASATNPITVSGSGSVYTVTVNGVSGVGSVGLNLSDSAGSIRNLAGNSLVASTYPVSFQSQTLSTGQGPVSVALADLTGDGIPDLVVINHISSTLEVFLGNANGTFGSPTTYATGAFPDSVVVADVNGDGLPDILVSFNGGNGYSNNGGVDVFLNNGNGTFHRAGSFAAGINPIGLSVGDLTGNGKLDLVVANHDDGPTANPNSLSVLMGNGDGTFQSARRSPSRSGLGSRRWLTSTGTASPISSSRAAVRSASC